MKINWKAFPWVTVLLTLCAVLVGVGFTFLLQLFLPSYKNTVVTVSDVPAINQLLYVEDTEELIIFPWDQFSADEGSTTEEFFQKHNEGDLKSAEWRKGLSAELGNQISNFLVTSQTNLEMWPDFLSYLRWYESDEPAGPLWVTLKGVPVRTDNGYDCLLDAAWNDMLDRCVFFHVYKKDPDPLLDSTVESANRYLDEIFQSHWTDPFPNGIFSEEFAPELEEKYDPILLWLSYVKDYAPLDADILALTMRSEKCERIAYRDEILLVYSPDSQHRLVLFYDPIRNKITGFSSNL